MMNLDVTPELIHTQAAQLTGLGSRSSGLYLALAAGMTMLLLGALLHKNAWIIPGGVLSGIGLGIVLLEGPWAVPEVRQSGLFLICFALGWFSITLLSRLTTRKTQWWALLPGGIMVLLGVAIMLQSL
jgi:hypothetical protein